MTCLHDRIVVKDDTSGVCAFCEQTVPLECAVYKGGKKFWFQPVSDSKRTWAHPANLPGWIEDRPGVWVEHDPS